MTMSESLSEYVRERSENGVQSADFGVQSVQRGRPALDLLCDAPAVKDHAAHAVTVIKTFIEVPSRSSPGNCSSRCSSIPASFKTFFAGACERSTDQDLTMEPSDSINSDGAMHTVDKKVAERRSPTLQQLFTAWTFARRKRLVEERAARLRQGVETRKEKRLLTREMDRKKTKDQDKKRQEVAVENNKVISPGAQPKSAVQMEESQETVEVVNLTKKQRRPRLDRWKAGPLLPPSDASTQPAALSVSPG